MRHPARYSTCNTHAHPFNGPFSWTTRVSRYQKGKTNLDFTEPRDSEWQWHQLGHMLFTDTSEHIRFFSLFSSCSPLLVFCAVD